MQLIQETKYTESFEIVLYEHDIPFKVEGPFPKNQPKHKLPQWLGDTPESRECIWEVKEFCKSR